MKQGNSLVTLVIVLLAVMLAAYLGVYAWDSFTDPFTTTLTYSYTANDSLEADGWVVREEQLLPAQSGILDITRAEGEEVGRGQTVALVHQNRPTTSSPPPGWTNPSSSPWPPCGSPPPLAPTVSWTTT